MKSDFMCSNGFQPFPGVEAYGKIPAHDASGLRNPFSHSCTGELKITANHSIFVTSVVFILLFLFFKSWRWCKVPQNIATAETERFQILVQVALKLWLLGPACFCQNTGNMAYHKFANPFGHKVLSLFHLPMN